MTNINLCGEQLTLLPEKAIYWESRACLLLADLHLGKAHYFRNAGMPVPLKVGEANFTRLRELLDSLELEAVYFLGDLFHSTYNDQWEAFAELLTAYPFITFHLVQGNHDILSDVQYQKVRMTLHTTGIELGPFWLTHEPEEDDIPEGLFNLCGHIHPSVGMRGAGRQYMRLPCFYFNDRQGILPAFGAFTGTAKLAVRTGDRVFVVAGDEVVAVY